MKHLGKWVLATILFFCGTVNVLAQSVKTVDTEGNPVSYASIADAKGKIIGVTNLEGVLSDVKGAKTITVSHVAFKTQTVNVANLENGTLTLEDADFDLPEITITKKEYIYVQTYYRVLDMEDDTLMYYRAGVTDNAYNIQKKTVSSDHHHFSKARWGLMKFALDNLVGGLFSKKSELPTKNFCLDKKSENENVTLVEEAPGRFRILYRDSLVGMMIDDMKDHERRLSIDEELYRNLYYADHGKSKIFEKHDAKKKNTESTLYMVYKLDDEGNCNVEDFMMAQYHSDYDSYDKYAKKDTHKRLWTEIYGTDRAYVTKKELNGKKRDNRVEMTYEELKRYEQEHNIPPLPGKAVEAIEDVIKK